MTRIDSGGETQVGFEQGTDLLDLGRRRHLDRTTPTEAVDIPVYRIELDPPPPSPIELFPKNSEGTTPEDPGAVKLPGLGDVNWGRFFGALTDAGYTGPVAVEVEDRAFEASLERRRDSLIISQRFLSPFVIG